MENLESIDAGAPAQYLTVEEVSAYLKLPEETVYKYARTGRIPASKVGRYWRFNRSLIDEWVASRSNQAPDSVRTYVVDDDPAIRNLYVRWLRSAGCEAEGFGDGGDMLDRLGEQDCDIVFLDLLMPSPSGVETLRGIRAVRPDQSVVIVTAHFDSELMEEAMDMGPLTVLRKPVDKQSLISTALARKRARS